MTKCKGIKCPYWEKKRVYICDGKEVPYCNFAHRELKLDEWKRVVYICDGCAFEKELRALEKIKEDGIIRKYPVYVDGIDYTVFMRNECGNEYAVTFYTGDQKDLTGFFDFDPEVTVTCYVDAAKHNYDLIEMIRYAIWTCFNYPSDDKLRALEAWDGH